MRAATKPRRALAMWLTKTPRVDVLPERRIRGGDALARATRKNLRPISQATNSSFTLLVAVRFYARDTANLGESHSIRVFNFIRCLKSCANGYS